MVKNQFYIYSGEVTIMLSVAWTTVVRQIEQNLKKEKNHENKYFRGFSLEEPNGLDARLFLF